MLRPVNRYRPKAPRLYSVRWLEARLDDLTSDIVRLRGKGCVTCPARTRLQCSHLFTRTWRPTRWDVEPNGNCHVQCEDCNKAHNNNKKPFRDYYIRTFGQEAYDALEVRAHSNVKITYPQLLEKWELYKTILEDEKRKIA